MIRKKAKKFKLTRIYLDELTKKEFGYMEVNKICDHKIFLNKLKLDLEFQLISDQRYTLRIFESGRGKITIISAPKK